MYIHRFTFDEQKIILKYRFPNNFFIFFILNFHILVANKVDNKKPTLNESSLSFISFEPNFFEKYKFLIKLNREIAKINLSKTISSTSENIH